MTTSLAVFAAVLVGIWLVAGLVVWHRLLLRGENVLVFLILLLLFIPIRRYTFPSSLPIHLEPYRVFLVLTAAGALLSLLIDTTWHWRPLIFGWIGALFVGTSLLSIALNLTAIDNEGLAGVVLQTFLLQLSWFAGWLIFRLFLTSPHRVLLALRTLVNGGTIVALAALIESRTEKNLFDEVLVHVRVLKQVKGQVIIFRQGAFRPVASAQHPIPLGVLFAMLLPLAVWLAFRDDQGKPGRRAWWLGCSFVLVLGAASTLSRIALLVIGLEAITCLILRPKALRALLPLGIVGVIALHIVTPGLEGKIYRSVFPAGGVAAEQSAGAGRNAAGRLYKASAALDDVKHHIVAGKGFGTRIVQGSRQNTLLLDDGYLSRWEETGLIGLIPMLLLPSVPFVLFYRRARRDHSPWGDLATALATMMPGIFVSWLLYDSFSYAQEVLFFFLLLAVGAWLLSEVPEFIAIETALPVSHSLYVSAVTARSHPNPVYQIGPG